MKIRNVIPSSRSTASDGKPLPLLVKGAAALICQTISEANLVEPGKVVFDFRRFIRSLVNMRTHSAPVTGEEKSLPQIIAEGYNPAFSACVFSYLGIKVPWGRRSRAVNETIIRGELVAWNAGE